MTSYAEDDVNKLNLNAILERNPLGSVLVASKVGDVSYLLCPLVMHHNSSLRSCLMPLKQAALMWVQAGDPVS